jgi:SpoVK/Ycf46/Vps4 family AAA+-type ATPase
MLTLIQSLRNLKRSILIVATNHVDKFDPAIMRPGRFDLLILVKPPSVESKIQLWKEVFQAPGEAKLGGEVFPREANLVERFTFPEWSTFMNACKDSKTKGQLTADIIRRH